MAKFNGYGGGGMNMQQMMKQAQKMQDDMLKSQAQLEETEVEGTAGGEAVKVTVTGKKQVVSVELKPEVVDPEDIEMLQDLIVAAANEALRQIDEYHEQKMGGISGGLNIPGIF